MRKRFVLLFLFLMFSIIFSELHLLALTEGKVVETENKRLFVAKGESITVDIGEKDVDIINVTNIVAEVYEPQNNVVIVDIGSSFTNIAIVKRSDIEFTREIALGGKYLTSQIERTLKIPFTEAEKKKISGDPEISYLFEDFIFNITAEVNKTINFFRSIKTSETLDKVYVTGGSSLLAGLKDKMKEETGLEVETINPFLMLGKNYGADKTLEDYMVFMPVALQLSARIKELK